MEVRSVQEGIVEAYNRDFSKHAPAVEVPRIVEIFNIIPSVLARENKKFMFGAIGKSARAREYETTLLWLTHAGIVSKSICVNKISLPLSAYANNSVFKLFYLDVGLLGCKAGLRPDVILGDGEFFEEFKGALASKSFTNFMRDNASVRRGYKLSVLPYQENERITNLPIYMASSIAS